MEHIPGILILNDNRTYGRHKSNNRLLYRCIPNDKTLSPVLIPYNINIGFSKVLKRKIMKKQLAHDKKWRFYEFNVV